MSVPLIWYIFFIQKKRLPQHSFATLFYIKSQRIFSFVTAIFTNIQQPAYNLPNTNCASLRIIHVFLRLIFIQAPPSPAKEYAGCCQLFIDHLNFPILHFFYLILYYTPSSPNPVGTDESLRRRHTGPKDKKEDLQRLVEENEEAPEEDEVEGYAGTDNVVSATVKQTTPYEMFPDTLQMS